MKPSKKRPASGIRKILTRKKPGNISPAVERFMQLVDLLSYQQGPRSQPAGLTNFTFWTGAGFSKSWDPTAPVGAVLFNLSQKIAEQIAESEVLLGVFGFDSSKGLSANQLRQIVYQIDMFERHSDVRSRYVDDQNLQLLRAALRAAVFEQFNKLSKLNYFDQHTQKFPLINPTKAQDDIIDFFAFLFRRLDGSQGYVEGIRTHFVTTNYDFIIETILDNTVGPDDSLFLYTYRGFTPTTVANQPNLVPVYDHWLTSHLLKINGGFEILQTGEGYTLDYGPRSTEEVRKRPPVLMLPSREQDYSNPYFRAIFPKAVRLLRDTTVLILVGYSLPEDDALIRFIIRQFAETTEDGRHKFIFYIGPSSDNEKRKRLLEVFPTLDLMDMPEVVTYQGGFDAFAAECLSTISA